MIFVICAMVEPHRACQCRVTADQPFGPTLPLQPFFQHFFFTIQSLHRVFILKINQRCRLSGCGVCQTQTGCVFSVDPSGELLTGRCNVPTISSGSRGTRGTRRICARCNLAVITISCPCISHNSFQASLYHTYWLTQVAACTVTSSLAPVYTVQRGTWHLSECQCCLVCSSLCSCLP